MNKQKQIDLSLVKKYDSFLNLLYYDDKHSMQRDILAGAMNVTLDVQKKILTYINESLDYNYIVSTCNSIHICSSKKDKLTILSLLEKCKSNASFLLWGITLDVRAISSENPTITKQQNDVLQRNYPNIFIYTDFDRAGRQTAYFYKKAFGYHPLYITNGRFGTIDYGAKDISEYRDKFGEDKAIELLLLTITHIIDVVNTNDNFITNQLNT